jgi:hypothetical protein
MRRMKTDRLRSGALKGQEDVKKLIWPKWGSCLSTVDSICSVD